MRRFFKLPKGFSETAIVYTVVIIGLALAGGLFIRFINYPPPVLNIPNGGLICCDKGNGPACQPYTDPQHPAITYNGQTYELVTSGAISSFCHRHRRDSGVKTPKGDPLNTNPNGDPIIFDTSDEFNRRPNECGTGNQDQLMCNINGTKTCVPIPNDILIYVCRQNCFTTPADKCCDQDAAGFGNPTTIYDIYYRMSDLNGFGVPGPLKDCTTCGPIDNDYHCGTPPTYGTGGVPGSGNPQIVISPSYYPEHKSLQLHTFPFTQNVQGNPHAIERSFCKPAVYLYPPQKQEISVKIAPKGNILATNPDYPANGWSVTAYPDGRIDFDNTSYDYLFYDAAIPDELLTKQNTGYVVAYNELSKLFATLLPQLGLNAKEQQEFSSYWLSVLPKASYYFVSVVPQKEIDAISPLTIHPAPDSILRVALNFQPLDKKITVQSPVLSSVTRSGFTVVEWGGLFKKDKNHPFSCFM